MNGGAPGLKSNQPNNIFKEMYLDFGTKMKMEENYQLVSSIFQCNFTLQDGDNSFRIEGWFSKKNKL